MPTSDGTRGAPAARRLTAADAAAFRAARHFGLADAPQAFGAALSDEEALGTAHYADILTRLPVFGVDGAAGFDGVGGIDLNGRAKTRHKGSVFGFYVRPEARGTGVADAVLSALIGHAREAGLRQLKLTVTANNAPAIRLYSRYGFVETGREPDSLYVDGDYFAEAMMVLRL